MAYALVALVACECGEPSDEERLRKQIDTTSVHLWVATKAAVAGGDEESADARARVLALMATYERLRANAAREGREESPTVQAADVLALAAAVWKLRAVGARMVRGAEEGPPLLPVLLEARGVAPSFAGLIDSDTDHALLLLGLAIAKLHPRAPVPVPEEILLYEGFHLDPDSLAVPTLHDPVRAVRAYVYSQCGYCNLAQADARALDAGAIDAVAGLLDDLGGCGDEAPPAPTSARGSGPSAGAAISPGCRSLAGDDLRRVGAAMRGIAHGGTAMCFLDKGDDPAAETELQAFVDASEQGGMAPEDLAVIRAYLAYRREDLAETRGQLMLAKQSQFVDESERAEIDRLIDRLDRDESDALAGYFDGVYLGAAVLGVVYHQLQEAGVFDALANAPAFHALRDFVLSATAGVSGAIDSADAATGEASRAAGSALEQGRQLWRRTVGP